MTSPKPSPKALLLLIIISVALLLVVSSAFAFPGKQKQPRRHASPLTGKATEVPALKAMEVPVQIPPGIMDQPTSSLIPAEVRVTDRLTQAYLPGVFITVYEDISESTERFISINNSITKPDGTAQFQLLPTGNYYAIASLPNYLISKTKFQAGTSGWVRNEIKLDKPPLKSSVKEEPPNTPPLAIFTATPQNGKAPLTVSFDASASSDPDGSITRYEWDFGENAYATVSASGRTTQHTYSTEGTYKARLNVTDDKGAYNRSEPIQVIVQANQPPVLIGVSGPNPNLIRFTRYQPKVFTILAQDPDGDRLQYKLQQPSPWVFGFVRMYASGEGDYGRSASYQYMDSPRFMILGGMGCEREVTVFVTDGTAEVSKTIQYSICNQG